MGSGKERCRGKDRRGWDRGERGQKNEERTEWEEKGKGRVEEISPTVISKSRRLWRPLAVGRQTTLQFIRLSIILEYSL